MASAEDVGGDAATPKCIDVFNLSKCRNGRKKYLFANWVYERVVTKKRDFHVQYLQYVGHSTVGERSMLILRWFGFDSVEYIDTCFSSIKFTPRVHV